MDADPRYIPPAAASGRRNAALRWLVAVILLALLVWAIAIGVQSRLEARSELRQESAELNQLTVSVIRPKLADAQEELILPGNMQAYLDTPIHARTNGYLRRWYFDIGARVKKGDLLAEIDAPEIEDQLLQARAELANAQTGLVLAEKTAERWESMLKKNAVSRQETDEKIAEREARKSALEAARFNVARLEKLKSYTRIHAPFDGVITARNTDRGALIEEGSDGGSGRELFHLSSTDRLRVYVNIPQSYSREALPGMSADLTLAEFPGRRFAGKLVRNAQAIDPVARTLLAEIAVENPKGELLPGSYAEVHLKLKPANQVLIVPVNALLFRPEGVQVGIVGPDQSVALANVELGRDFGTTIEVIFGLDPEARVILNPVDSLVAGTRVRVVTEGGDAAKSSDKKAELKGSQAAAK